MRRVISVLILGAFSSVISLTGIAADKPKSVGSPFDLAVANETRLMAMMKNSGKIPANASMADAERALQEYLIDRQKKGQLRSHDLDNSLVEMRGKEGKLHKYQKLKKTIKNYRESHGNKNCDGPSWKNFWKNKTKLNCVEEEIYTGEKRTARILSILMEFPDFPHNSISPESTDMYYEDYTKEHYEKLLYSKTGFTGPNGENLTSVLQYYEAQSGDSYSIEGTVAGWYMASQPAAFYGNNETGNDRQLIIEALLLANADPSIDLEDFDIEDRFDLDGDGDLWEPDGLVDHVQVFHSSIGEEAGGGKLGDDAIWSHRWNLGDILTFEGTETEIPDWGGMMGSYDYTIQPIDAAAGVVAHEYGHDLGLPDEYDTQYTGRGEPVSSWSIMSNGSWAGKVPGSEPTGFSAWSKEFLQAAMGGNWLTGTTYELDELGGWGKTVLLDRASTKGTNNDVIRINLPEKVTPLAVPVSGDFVYFSGKGNDLFNVMTVELNLTEATTASLSFKAWLDIEEDWDYAYVLVNDMPIEGSITTTTDPFGNNFGNGITGTSDGWVDAVFNLTAFIGAPVTLQIVYFTDSFVEQEGLYIDDIVIEIDSETFLTDNAETTPGAFILDGFVQSDGNKYNEHYYLAEWRTHHGVDNGLKNVYVGGERLPFNEGLVLWYADTGFSENWVGIHPGDGFIGVVDADQRLNVWSDGQVAGTRYQVHDAAFSLDHSEPVFLDLTELLGATLTDDATSPTRMFNDRRSYIKDEIPDAGRNITQYGLKIKVLDQSKDKSVAQIYLRK